MPRKFKPVQTNGLSLALNSHHAICDPETLELLKIFRQLSEHDQQVIDGCVQALVSREIPGLGIKCAFELVAKIGIYMAWKEGRHGIKQST